MCGDFELFPGFSTPPTAPRLYVNRREYRQEPNYEKDYPSEPEYRGVPSRAGLTITPEPGQYYRTCPYCQGDGVKGWDSKERDIPCDHCEGGVIL